jgi:hypothetical protein
MNLLATLLIACSCALLLHSAAQADESLAWHDATTLKIEGRAWGDTESFFDRLPARALSQVNDDIRGLAKHSAGLAIRFTTDADTLRVHWSLGEPASAMTHMAATGTSGLDLYARIADGGGVSPELSSAPSLRYLGSRPCPGTARACHDHGKGVTPDGGWAYMGTGRPDGGQDNEWLAFANQPKTPRTFLLYLPLFNRVTSLRLGLAAGSSFQIVPNASGRTVVFYGTSIVHGGCASRPGMAYPAIIGRRLDCETVNLGFSGSARMEPIVCDLLAELDPAAYVIDALPNMHDEPITEKTLNLARTIRKRRPTAPIVLVENITYQATRAFGGDNSGARDINARFRKAYDQLLAEGCPDLLYVPGDNLLGADGEGTVDGTHPTDLGFSRMAEVLGPAVAHALARSASAQPNP